MPARLAPLSTRWSRIAVGALACLPLPALASDFTGLLTGMTLLLLAATELLLLPMLLFRRHAWVRWLGTVLGGVALLIGMGTVALDTWRIVARIGLHDLLPVGVWVLGYLLLWLAVGYTTYRLVRKPPSGSRKA